jgi:hypothetical protein
MGNTQSGMAIGLIETEFGTVYGKRITDQDGRYRFIVPSNSYKLVSLDPRYILDKELNITLEDKPDRPISITEDFVVRRKN